ncbi:hypothetical protein FA09DRAFT_330689 [Tilletiopsis washingtonensis]|uniref:Uncharacterized protein n=1 Tax=Tilletiopsis washingtonensis TaxID=58919 RepID=A0A316Z5Z5_9BASI|nr:hypothetical protein FA09DRAFT_330689 [Tilletiopsis washingtonensis]PWN97039.1 hypothetical protein FA09DRAFT_330689 [Tilletiopsis washingtonensis]
MLYSFLLSSLVVVLLIIGYMNRAALLPLLPEHIVERLPAALRAPPSGARYSRLSAFDWASQARAGLSSARFDIEANLRDGDARAGLDEIGSLEVNAVMASRNMTFDQARLHIHEQRLRDNGIDPRTGLSLDAKSVTFANLR